MVLRALSALKALEALTALTKTMKIIQVNSLPADYQKMQNPLKSWVHPFDFEAQTISEALIAAKRTAEFQRTRY